MEEVNTSLALLSVSKAAKELKIGRNRIYELIEKGELGVVEFDSGRIKIPFAELKRWVQDKTRFTIKPRIPENGTNARYVEAFDAHNILFGNFKRSRKYEC